MKTTFTEGLRACFAGAPISDCPYPAETIDGRNWRTGWDAGKAPIQPYNVIDLHGRRMAARPGRPEKSRSAR
ncbi:MAG: hypothetical protein KGM42_18310 [Hyphomicrobiales bacterium]|nr:hypothetical protein [Hyphomicrobiales bacterium]